MTPKYCGSADSVPLISVVVPTYNRAHLILDALDSVASQSYRPMELIVVDDGSTDDTEKIVSEWWKQHSSTGMSFRFIKQSNLGGNKARNSGIEAATGKYIGFLDSDDRWHSSKLEQQLEVLEYNPSAGAVYCGVQQIDLDSGQRIEPSNRSYPTGNLLDQLLVKDVTAPTSTYLVRKEVFAEVGLFDETLMARQDWDMWIRIATKYEIEAVPLPLVDLREHSGPRTASNPQREIDAFNAMMSKYAHLRNTRSLSVRQSAKATYYRRLGRVHLHHHLGRFKAIAYYIRATTAWPFDFDNYAALLGWFMPSGFRARLHRQWNSIFGGTIFSIRSH